MDKETIKLKPAKKVSKEKINEVIENEEALSSFVDSTSKCSESNPSVDKQTEDADIIVPECHQSPEILDILQDKQMGEGTEDMSISEVNLHEFCVYLETTLINALDNRAEAQRKAREEWIRQQEADGVDIITPENALAKCVKFINIIKDEYDMYRNQKNAIALEQTQTLETVKQQADTAKRLEAIIGRIENLQGIKAPRRPPFPSWACLAYLFWHWPMYAFSYLWLSKYFRRFCFLIAFFVMVLEFCLIVLLAGENRTIHHERAKYVTVRNWSYVAGDTTAVNRFNEVDILFEDTKFNREKIEQLNDHIRSKHELMLQKQRRK